MIEERCTHSYVAATIEITTTIEIIISVGLRMHLKLNSPSPTIEKTTTTEITFTIEIVMSLVLFFK